MGTLGIITIVIIIANVVISYRGLTNQSFFEGYKFNVDSILVRKDYVRMLSSGFLHVDWMHLLFNMYSLFAFSMALEADLGMLNFLILYFASLLGGNLFALFIHRHHGDYSAVGASGAVCGLIFASIALYPGMGVGMFFIPVSVPGWLYGLVYVLYTIYGIRSRRDNIGHEAHLGGGLVGLLIAVAMHPKALVVNYIPILLIVVPSAVFIYILFRHPVVMIVDKPFSKKPVYQTLDDKYNTEKANRQKAIDNILDKINQRGIDSLSKQERELLDDYSKKGR